MYDSYTARLNVGFVITVVFAGSRSVRVTVDAWPCLAVEHSVMYTWRAELLHGCMYVSSGRVRWR